MANEEACATGLWWLSFSDGYRPKGEQFLGCVIAPGNGFLDAVSSTWTNNVNPGGAVFGLPIPADAAVLIDDNLRMRLLSRVECEELDAKLLDAVGRMSKGGAA